ncbi:MAG: LysR substrate-binding domain-containing protein [Kiloniellales bacterium]|nr:LysR substrate-binding domain-containing protein [Kiloniellales bacterium]
MDRLLELEVYVQVVHAGSFTAAGRDLGLSPSAVSKQIGRLEDRLGVRLLNRTTRKVAMTEEGAAFFDHAKRIIADLGEAEQALSHLRAAPRGLLRVNMPVTIGHLILAPLIPEFLRRYPDVEVDLTLNDRLVDLVEEGMDLGIRIGELKDSSLIARKLAASRRAVCAAPGYLERAGTPHRPADLADHNCLVYTYRTWRNDWPFRGPEGGETVHVTGSFSANNGEVLRQAALGGSGIIMLPIWQVRDDLMTGRLIELLPDYSSPDADIHAVYPQTRYLAPRVRAFVDFLALEFGAMARSWRAGDATA